MFVDLHKGFLAASPDGTVGKDGLVEVKCPLSCRDESIEDLARQDHSFCLEYHTGEDKLRLKRTHNYYYQVSYSFFCPNFGPPTLCQQGFDPP